jgi:hypothetical protein
LVLFKDTFLARALGYLLLALALYAALVSARIVVQTRSPVLFGDQWVIVDDLQHSHGPFPTERLWHQHNEHRIPLARLASYADLLLFGGRGTFLLILNFFIQLAHLAILLAVLRKFGPGDPRFEIPAAAVCLYAVFAPLQIENFIWGFQTQFLLVLCAASLAFAFAVTQTPPFAGLIAAAWLAELSLSNGVLIWPILSLVAFGLGYSRRRQIQLGVIGAASVAVYLYGYRTPFYHSSPLDSLLHPVAVLRFVVTYFRFSGDPTMPEGNLWPTFAESITLIAIVWVLTGAVRCFVLRRPGFSRLEWFCYANQLFILSSATVTALGRLRFGAGQATSSRYQGLALLFWACTAILILLRAVARAENSKAWIACEALLVVLLLAQPLRFGAVEAFARNRQVNSAKAYSALVRNTNDREAIQQIFPSVEAVTNWYGYLKSHNLGPDPRDFGGVAPPAPNPGRLAVYPASDPPQLKGYQIAHPEACFGFLDEALPVDGSPHAFTISGWAWERTGARLPGKVALAFPDGSVAQTAEFTLPRPDVQKALPEITALNTGWRTTIQAGPGVHLRAYAILADQKTACALTDQFIAP